MKQPISRHYYRHDPETGCCEAPGLHGAVCGLPRGNAHHDVPEPDPERLAAEARRLGEHIEESE